MSGELTPVSGLVAKWRKRAVNCGAGVLARNHIEGCAAELEAALRAQPATTTLMDAQNLFDDLHSSGLVGLCAPEDEIVAWLREKLTQPATAPAPLAGVLNDAVNWLREGVEKLRHYRAKDYPATLCAPEDEIVAWLREKLTQPATAPAPPADLLRAIELAIGFCVAFREDVPDWKRFPQVGVLFSKLTIARDAALAAQPPAKGPDALREALGKVPEAVYAMYLSEPERETVRAALAPPAESAKGPA